MKKIITTILMAVVLFFGAFLPVRAQFVNDNEDMLRQEISIHFAKPGIGALPFLGTMTWNSPQSKGSFGMAAAYTYWLNENMGITSGMHFTYLYFSEELDNIVSIAHGTEEVRAPSTSTFSGTPTPLNKRVATTMTVNTPKVIEEQSLLMFDIPVQFTYQHQITSNRYNSYLFGCLGFGLATPITTYGSYAYDASNYYLTAIDDLGIRFRKPILMEIDEGNEGTYTPAEVKQPFFFELAADCGWKYAFDNRNFISLSIFARYALNKCKISNSGFDIINISNSVSSARSPMQAGLVDSYRYYAVGLSITYHWGFGKPIR